MGEMIWMGLATGVGLVLFSIAVKVFRGPGPASELEERVGEINLRLARLEARVAKRRTDPLDA
jgi:hypothetical protein